MQSSGTLAQGAGKTDQVVHGRTELNDAERAKITKWAEQCVGDERAQAEWLEVWNEMDLVSQQAVEHGEDGRRHFRSEVERIERERDLETRHALDQMCSAATAQGTTMAGYVLDLQRTCTQVQ